MSSLSQNAGSLLKSRQTREQVELQNMRSFQFSIVKLKIGNNEPQWRASVLTASSLLGADHQLDGTRVVSLTQAQYDQMSALHGTQAKAKSLSTPHLEWPIKKEQNSASQKRRSDFESQPEHDASDTWEIPVDSPHDSFNGVIPTLQSVQ